MKSDIARPDPIMDPISIRLYYVLQGCGVIFITVYQI